MMKLKSTITIQMDRKTAMYLKALVGSLETNTGIGDRLTKLWTLLDNDEVHDLDVGFRLGDTDETVVMFTKSANDDY